MAIDWKGKAWAAIDTIMKANPDAGVEELRVLLRDAYPFGERKYHPYRVWLRCVKVALIGRENGQW